MEKKIRSRKVFLKVFSGFHKIYEKVSVARLTVSVKVLKFYHFFPANNLFPENLKDMSKSQLNSYEQNTKRNFVTDNFEFLHLIFDK